MYTSLKNLSLLGKYNIYFHEIGIVIVHVSFELSPKYFLIKIPHINGRLTSIQCHIISIGIISKLESDIYNNTLIKSANYLNFKHFKGSQSMYSVLSLNDHNNIFLNDINLGFPSVVFIQKDIIILLFTVIMPTENNLHS